MNNLLAEKGGVLLPAGFPARQAVHELRAPEGTAGHVAFAVLLLARLQGNAPMLWVSATPWLYPPGLSWLGLDPARLLLAQGRDDAECLGALEVALRGGMAGVAETKLLPRLAARRLALAAKQGGGVGFLLRHAPRQTALDSTAPASRWLITPTPGTIAATMTLRAELLYAKGGASGIFFLHMQREEDHGAAFSIALAGQPAAAAFGRRTG